MPSSPAVSLRDHRSAPYSHSFPSRPPALILGGGANALSIARSLGRKGTRTYAINTPTAAVRYSRFARWIPLPQGDAKTIWTRFLLSEASDYLRGAVLFPASDDALEILIEHHEQLSQKYQLDLCVPSAQAAMLNKLKTYQAARRAGIDTPQFWLAQSQDQIASLRDELVFPLLMKPIYSHKFAARFGVKYLVAENYEQLSDAWSQVGDENLEVMLVEKIPGPDSRLCSYYTYIDHQGEHLFGFTKRIVRRFPPEMGIACRHVTDDVPDLAEPAAALFQEVGLRGVANVEFKLDPRDGRLKLIECNARLTAANTLLDQCGHDLALFVYQQVIGGETVSFRKPAKPMYLWNPIDDLRAFLALRRSGHLNLRQWLRSIAASNVTFPYFQWNDPLPAVMGTRNRIVRQFQRVFRKFRKGEA